MANENENGLIARVSDDTKQALKRLSAESLPNRPSAAGMKAEDIKKAFFEPIYNANHSAIAEIDRVIDEVNTAFEDVEKSIDQKISTEMSDNISQITQIKTYTENIKTETENLRDEMLGIKSSAAADMAATSSEVLIKPVASGELVYIEDASSLPIQELTIYGRSVQNGTPSPDNPIEIESVGDSGSVDVNVLGKNLCPNDKNSSSSTAGVYLTYNTEKECFVMTGTPTADGNIRIVNPSEYKLISGKEYYAKTFGDTGGKTIFIGYKRDNSSSWANLCYASPTTKAFTYPEFDDARLAVYIPFTQGTTYNLEFKVLIEATNTGTYEPYKSIRTATIEDIEPLRGILVKSGGNVTIDGQQYIADTLTVNADGSGVITRRVKKIKITSNMVDDIALTASDSQIYRCIISNVKDISVAVSTACASTHFKAGATNATSGIDGNLSINKGLGLIFFVIEKFKTVDEYKEFYDANEVYVIYPCTPTTQQLSQEQVQSLLALHTYKPISNIYNTDGAFIDATYIADTKVYIDNKFTELQNAILAQGGNV